jgi:hypothetical protein
MVTWPTAVDPGMRHRGVHRALLDRRCADAATTGARVGFSGADYLGASSRNMIRKGFGVLYTKAIWTLRQPRAAASEAAGDPPLGAAAQISLPIRTRALTINASSIRAAAMCRRGSDDVVRAVAGLKRLKRPGGLPCACF